MSLRLQYLLFFNKHATSLCGRPRSVLRSTGITGQNSWKFISSHLVVPGKRENISDKYPLNSVEDYLANVGTGVAKIHKEVRISKLELCERLKLVAGVLEEQCNLEAIDVGRMATKRPRIVLLSREQIEKSIEMLRNIGLKQENIMFMVKKSPGILTSRIEETLEKKASFVG